MSLQCTEQPMDTSVCLAQNDAVIFRDDRVLESLLRTERSYMPGGNYFGTVQNDIQPYMRKMVTSWMLEVSTVLVKVRFQSCSGHAFTWVLA